LHQVFKIIPGAIAGSYILKRKLLLENQPLAGGIEKEVLPAKNVYCFIYFTPAIIFFNKPFLNNRDAQRLQDIRI